MVSPAPAVPKLSSTSPCFLKMPASWPSVGIWFSQLLICPIATLSWSSARAEYGAPSSDATSANVQANVLVRCRCMTVLPLLQDRVRWRLTALPFAGLDRGALDFALPRRGGIRPASASRHDQYSHVRPTTLGIALMAPASLVSPGDNGTTLPSICACS